MSRQAQLSKYSIVDFELLLFIKGVNYSSTDKQIYKIYKKNGGKGAKDTVKRGWNAAKKIFEKTIENLEFADDKFKMQVDDQYVFAENEVDVAMDLMSFVFNSFPLKCDNLSDDLELAYNRSAQTMKINCSESKGMIKKLIKNNIFYVHPDTHKLLGINPFIFNQEFIALNNDSKILSLSRSNQANTNNNNSNQSASVCPLESELDRTGMLFNVNIPIFFKKSFDIRYYGNKCYFECFEVGQTANPTATITVTGCLLNGFQDSLYLLGGKAAKVKYEYRFNASGSEKGKTSSLQLILESGDAVEETLKEFIFNKKY